MTRLVYVSPVPWQSMPQRPHYFVEQALRHGISRVLWLEPTPSRLPRARDMRRRRDGGEPGNQLNDSRVQVVPGRLLPVEPVPLIGPLVNAPGVNAILRKVRAFADVGPTILVVGKPTRLALAVVENGGEWLSTAYDAMDNFPAFFQGWTRRSVASIESRLVDRVDHLICSASRLQQRFPRDSLLVRNACSSQLQRRLAEIPKKKNARPVLGFVGTIADWLDWQVIERLARTLNDCRIVMVGPRKGAIPSGLPDNIEFRNAVDREGLAQLLRTFDFGLVPFRKSDLTDCVDPIKYYEYCAAGAGVIATRFGEMADRREAASVWDFDSIFQAGALPEPGREALENVVTWEQRFDAGFFSKLLR